MSFQYSTDNLPFSLSYSEQARIELVDKEIRCLPVWNREDGTAYVPEGVRRFTAKETMRVFWMELTRIYASSCIQCCPGAPLHGWYSEQAAANRERIERDRISRDLALAARTTHRRIA